MIPGCVERDYSNQSLRITSSEEQRQILTEYRCHHKETDTRSYFFLPRNNADSSLLLSPYSYILHNGMENELKLSNSVDIYFGKSSDPGSNYCSAT